MEYSQFIDIISQWSQDERRAVSVLMEAAYASRGAFEVCDHVENLLSCADDCDMLDMVCEAN